MWKKEQPLDNVCDGTIASDEMVRNVLSARKTGEDVMTKFLRDLPLQVLMLLIQKEQNTMTQSRSRRSTLHQPATKEKEASNNFRRQV